MLLTWSLHKSKYPAIVNLFELKTQLKTHPYTDRISTKIGQARDLDDVIKNPSFVVVIVQHEIPSSRKLDLIKAGYRPAEKPAVETDARNNPPGNENQATKKFNFNILITANKARY